MTQRPSNKRALNINIPDDLSNELDLYCKETGYSKTQVVMVAINQFLAIKHEEQDFRKSNPGRRVKARVVLETQPLEDDKQRLASVLLY